jgi:hypothetical protein
MNSKMLLLLSTGSLGIFLGAQIAEAFLIVPYWKKLQPDKFFDFYKTNSSRLNKFFSPLTILATASTLIAVINLLIFQSSEQTILIMIGISTLIYFSTYFIYFKKANRRFVNQTIAHNDLSVELVKWEKWHWGRIIFESIAFILSLSIL